MNWTANEVSSGVDFLFHNKGTNNLSKVITKFRS